MCHADQIRKNQTEDYPHALRRAPHPANPLRPTFRVARMILRCSPPPTASALRTYQGGPLVLSVAFL